MLRNTQDIIVEIDAGDDIDYEDLVATNDPAVIKKVLCSYIKEENYVIAQNLVDGGAVITESILSKFLVQGAKEDDEDLVRFLLINYAGYSDELTEAMYYAVHNDSESMMELICNEGSPTPEDCEEALREAANNRSISVVNYFLDDDIDHLNIVMSIAIELEEKDDSDATVLYGIVTERLEENNHIDLSDTLLTSLSPENFNIIARLAKKIKQHISFFAYLPAQNDCLIEKLAQHGNYLEYDFEKFLSSGLCNVAEIYHQSSLTAYLAQKDYTALFKTALKYGGKITQVEYDIAGVNAKRVLNYRPGRNQKNIMDSLLARRVDTEKIRAMVLDQEDTTDNESSDDEEDDNDDNEIKAVNREVYDQHRSQLLKTKNNPAQNDQLRIVTYRGMHFCPMHFTQAQRRAEYENLASGKAAASMATLSAAGYRPNDQVDEESKELKDAHQRFKQFFHDLKESKDKQETRQVARNKRQFPALIYRFIEAYVMNYRNLFTEGDIVTDFGARTAHNPVVSTSYKVERSMHYTGGSRMNPKTFSNTRLDPHYRRSTGKPKHPHLGFTDVFVLNPAYVKANGWHILDLIAQGKITINHFYKFEYEIAFESLIPGKFHYHRELLTLPRFDQPYNKQFKKIYGIDNSYFTRLRNELCKLECHRNSEEYVALVNRIIEYVIKQRAAKLENAITDRLHAEVDGSKFVVYPYKEGAICDKLIDAKNKTWNASL